jgi:hypothetical protein
VDSSLDATFFRTALLLGMVKGDIVLRWADELIARAPAPSEPLIELATVPVLDLSGLRHALWPLVIDPPPLEVLEAILARLHADLAAGSRGETDTLAIVRQIRSMVRLPRGLYADLNEMLVAYDAAAQARVVLETWLRRFVRPHAWQPGGDLPQ